MQLQASQIPRYAIFKIALVSRHHTYCVKIVRVDLSIGSLASQSFFRAVSSHNLQKLYSGPMWMGGGGNLILILSHTVKTSVVFWNSVLPNAHIICSKCKLIETNGRPVPISAVVTEEGHQEAVVLVPSQRINTVLENLRRWEEFWNRD